MVSMTDIIEKYIKNLMIENNSIQIQRNELANMFSCAPSQINYVLATRFTLDRGYCIESKKGGGGYIQIIKVQNNKQSYLEELINKNIGDKISYKRAKEIIEGLEEMKIVSNKEKKFILSSLDERALCMETVEKREEIRANIFKNIIEVLLRTNIN